MRRFCIALLSIVALSNVEAEVVRVAVASNFIKPMETLISQFEQESGHKVEVSFSSSGKHYTQILRGAPFEMFLSADQDKPQRLEQQGLVVPGYRTTYAVGRLVLWSKDPRLIHNSAEVLATQNYQHLAIANPELAPYGRAATEVLQALNLLEFTRPRWVVGKSISQTYQFVMSQNAELGWVAASQVMQGGQIVSGSGWIVPESMHQPIRQDMVLLVRGEKNSAARALFEFITQDSTQAVIRSFGYR